MPDDWTLTGQCDTRYIIEKLTPLVEEEPAGLEVKKTFKEKFHSTWDNFFSGDVIMDWIVQKWFAGTMPYYRDRLSLGILGKYFHKQKTISYSKTKVTRFIQPIVAIKEYDGGDDLTSYQRVHCSF